MSDLPPIQQILGEFDATLELKRQGWLELRRLNPNATSTSERLWQKEYDRHWVRCQDVETRCATICHPTAHEVDAVEKISATKLYDRWQLNLSSINSDYSEYFLQDGSFPQYRIPCPRDAESLGQYVHRLAALISAKEPPSTLEERCIRSFLRFLRESLPSSKIGFLERVFPAEMEIREIRGSDWVETSSGPEVREITRSMVLRRMGPRGHPLPLVVAAQILRILADKARHGRSDSKRTASETLGLCWICLTAARLRLFVHVEALVQLPASCLHGSDSRASPTITIPTLEGVRAVPISQTLGSFLNALKMEGKLFDRTEKSLYRELARTVKNLPDGLIQGRIGFQTFLMIPHEFGNHRYHPQSHKKPSKKCQSLCKS